MARTGRPKADNPMDICYSFCIDHATDEMLSHYCIAHGISRGAAIRRGIRLLLDQSGMFTERKEDHQFFAAEDKPYVAELKTRTFSIRMSESQLQDLKQCAQMLGVSMNDVIRHGFELVKNEIGQ